MSETLPGQPPNLKPEDTPQTFNPIDDKNKKTKETTPAKEKQPPKENRLTKAQLEAKAKQELERDKEAVTALLSENIDRPLDELKAKYPNINSKVFAGIKSSIINKNKNEETIVKRVLLTLQKLNINTEKDQTNTEKPVTQQPVQQNPPEKAIEASTLATTFASMGLNTDLANKAAEHFVRYIAEQSRSAEFTKTPENQNPPPAANPPPIRTEQPPPPSQEKNVNDGQGDKPMTRNDFMAYLAEVSKQGSRRPDEPGRYPQRGGGLMQEDVQIDTGSSVPRTVYFTPKSLMWFDISRKDGYPYDLSSFMNDCIAKYFEKKNMQIGFVSQVESI